MKKLLIIEDDPMMAKFLANLFAKDYQICLNESPEEALENCIKHGLQYDLLISDFKSLENNQSISLKAVLKRMKWSNTPSILLTDEDLSDQRLEALSLGATIALSKPFNPIELLVRMNVVLGQQKNNETRRHVA